MIAPAQISAEFRAWNLRHGAPAGHRVRFQRVLRHLMSARQMRGRQGPFSLQVNNTTRTFEYPWAFAAAELPPAARVLEIGGSLAGFQFVLARQGCAVVNVDPGMAASGVGWPCDANSMAELNRTFGTDVELRNCTVDRAGLADSEFDTVFCLSVIEHLPAEDASAVMAHAFRVLKPGGRFVLTVDLFLNLHPFTRRQQNEYGVNCNVRELIARQPWQLVGGERAELFGFPEFEAEAIQSRLEQFFVGSYPALAQCFVLKKPL